MLCRHIATCLHKLWRMVEKWAMHHNSDVIMNAMVSQVTSLTVVYSTAYLGADQRKHQSFASLAFVRGIHRWPVNSPHKRPLTRKCFHLMTSSCASSYTINLILRSQVTHGFVQHSNDHMTFYFTLNSQKCLEVGSCVYTLGLYMYCQANNQLLYFLIHTKRQMNWPTICMRQFKSTVLKILFTFDKNVHWTFIITHR